MKMASSSHFCEVSEDKIEWLLESAILRDDEKCSLQSLFLLKQLDYSLSISMR